MNTAELQELRIIQKQKLLAYLKTGNSINQPEAVTIGIWRLGARVFELRREGYNIISSREKSGDSLFVRYRLIMN